jgi:hypothetical protein
MESWRVVLAKRFQTTMGENGLYSLAEMKAKEEEKNGTYIAVAERGQKLEEIVDKSEALRATSMAFRRKVRQNDTSGSPLQSLRPQSLIVGAPAARSAFHGHGPSVAPAAGDSQRDLSSDLFDDVATVDAGDSISHSLAGSDTYGFTTTYELPTPRTIPSSPLVRRHVIAEIPLLSLFFTHILVPKLKAAAFLKAKVTNTSNVPLLQGQAGLTLDGSFMGNLTFPRCSPSETVVLELGVDQSVKVEYERPTAKHGTQGIVIIGKEEVGVYKVGDLTSKRLCWGTHTMFCSAR